MFSTSLPADELISIKVITGGADFWFYAGGQYVGSASHGGGATGGVGLAMLCFDDSAFCSAGFGNLTVRSLAT